MKRRKKNLILGLPENPISSLVNFYLFIKPAIEHMLHPKSTDFISTVLSDDLKKKDGKRHFMRGILYEENYERKVTAKFLQSSGNLVEMSHTNCLIEIEEE